MRIHAVVVFSWGLLQSLRLFAPDVSLQSGVRGTIEVVHLIAAPHLALAAVYLSAQDRLPWAIIALAAVSLTTWAAELATSPFLGLKR